jgi:amino acid transporter
MAWKIFRRKTLETLIAEMAGEHRLHRVLGPVSLTMLGVGAIIGAGIFAMTGRVAAEDAGPAIMVSFAVAGVACAFAALCHSGFAAMVPVAGSAYTYTYATLGEVWAWIIGWDLILEYAMSCAVVAAQEEMVSIGTLLAFVLVCGSVLALRIRRPDVHRPFRCPALYVVAPLGILVNLAMMLFLPLDTWLRLAIWLGVGLVVYLAYGIRHSTLGHHLEREMTTHGLSPTDAPLD